MSWRDFPTNFCLIFFSVVVDLALLCCSDKSLIEFRNIFLVRSALLNFCVELKIYIQESYEKLKLHSRLSPDRFICCDNLCCFVFVVVHKWDRERTICLLQCTQNRTRASALFLLSVCIQQSWTEQKEKNSNKYFMNVNTETHIH